MEQGEKSDRIILAADEPSARAALSRLFMDLGCVVCIVEDPDSLDSEADEQPPLCIFLDLDSSRNDWLIAVLSIRRRSKLFNVPVLFTSADGARGIDVFIHFQEFEPNSIEYLSKPVSFQELAFHIGRLRARRAAGRDPNRLSAA